MAEAALPENAFSIYSGGFRSGFTPDSLLSSTTLGLEALYLNFIGFDKIILTLEASVKGISRFRASFSLPAENRACRKYSFSSAHLLCMSMK